MQLLGYIATVIGGLEVLIGFIKALLKFYRDMKHRNEFSTILYNAV